MSVAITAVVGLLCVGSAAGFVALLVWLVVRAQRLARERREGMAWFAAQREWSYLPSDPRLVSRFVGAPFGRGSSQQALNVIHGTHSGRPFTAFDYRYVTHSTDGDGRSSSSVHSCSVVAMSLGVAVPNLSVAPQGGVGRFFGKLFGTDLRVGDPAFDDRFAVSADDLRFATDVLHPGMRAMLMSWSDLAWRLSVDSLVVFRIGVHSPAEIDAKLGAMDAIVAAVPAQVWTNLGAPGLAPE
jgi:hypothetical protein